MFARIVCLTVLTLCGPAFAEGISRPGVSSPKISDDGAAAAKGQSAKGQSIDERILFQPAVFPTGYYDRKPKTVEDVEFTAADKTALHGWFSKAANPKAVVLYSHGNGGNVSFFGSFLEKLSSERHLTVLMFDYRGYGKSAGIPTVDGVVSDGKAARQKLAELCGVKENEIVLWGQSLGGAVAVKLAADLNPRALVLESTFSSFRDVAHVHQPTLSWLVPLDRLNSAATIATVECPLLLAHGTADRIVPYPLGQKLFAAAREPKVMLTFKGRDHNLPPPAEFYRRLDAFLADARKSATKP